MNGLDGKSEVILDADCGSDLNLSANCYLRVILKHELVPSQEVVFGKQLHVLTDVLHKLDGIRLSMNTEKPSAVDTGTDRGGVPVCVCLSVCVYCSTCS